MLEILANLAAAPSRRERTGLEMAECWHSIYITHFEAYCEDVSNNLTTKPGSYDAPKQTLHFTEQHGVP